MAINSESANNPNEKHERPIVFFGTGDFSLAALTGLIESSYSIAAVVTKPDSRKGRGQRIFPPPVKILAARHNIPTWQPDKLADISGAIKELGYPIGVLVSYGKIIPQSIIDLFYPGIINIHPSLLPRYRGPSPIETVIASGDTTTGVTIMQLSSGVDNGPVYAAKEYPLSGAETRPELYHTLAGVGTNLLLETLPRILDGSLLPIPQKEAESTHTTLLNKADAWLTPETVTAAEAERLIRAHLGFPRTKLMINGHTVIITKAHVSPVRKSSLDIHCMDGGILTLDEIIAPSGRRMNAAEFERGYLTPRE